jgi:hypothetical protein
VVDQAVDEPAHRGRRGPEAGDELRHVELPGEAQEVQQLGLGHRDVDLQELRRVAVGEPLHEPLEAGDHRLDVVGTVRSDGGPFLWLRQIVRLDRTIRSQRYNGFRECVEDRPVARWITPGERLSRSRAAVPSSDPPVAPPDIPRD